MHRKIVGSVLLGVLMLANSALAALPKEGVYEKHSAAGALEARMYVMGEQGATKYTFGYGNDSTQIIWLEGFLPNGERHSEFATKYVWKTDSIGAAEAALILDREEIDELKNHESSISSKIKKMQQEYDEQIKKNNSSNNGSINNGTSSYGFGWPVSNHTIGTSYGVAGSYWSSGYHTGIDFPVLSGTPVYSVGDGQVFDTGYNSAYGNFVEIYHGNNVYSFYAHATSVRVSVGQKVSKGQQIMISGSTGNVSGPHLHFEIRTPGYRYANCVNPRPYLP